MPAKDFPMIPRSPMKLVPNASGGYDLLLKHPVGGQLITVAHVLETPAHGPDEARAFSLVLSAAFLMMHVLDDIMEYAQPECWDPASSDGAIWRAAFRALLTAQGEPVPAMFQPDEGGIDD